MRGLSQESWRTSFPYLTSAERAKKLHLFLTPPHPSPPWPSPAPQRKDWGVAVAAMVGLVVVVVVCCWVHGERNEGGVWYTGDGCFYDCVLPPPPLPSLLLVIDSHYHHHMHHYHHYDNTITPTPYICFRHHLQYHHHLIPCDLHQHHCYSTSMYHPSLFYLHHHHLQHTVTVMINSAASISATHH